MKKRKEEKELINKEEIIHASVENLT